MEAQLRDELEQKMETSYWGREPQSFLPHNVLAKLLTPTTIEACIPEASSELATFVSDQARKVFAILLHSKCQNLSLEKALQLCQQYRLTDETLPIPKPVAPNQYSKKSLDGTCTRPPLRHEPHLNIFHERGWGPAAWGSFYRGQWHFLAPVFDFNQFEYTFEPGTILPIIEYGDGHGEGYFGSVKEAFLHPHHLSGFPEDTDKPLRVAIKEFFDPERGTAGELGAEGAWRAETIALAEMQQHTHLIKRVAAVAVGQQYLLISEWADGGDLQSFWRNNPNPTPDADLIWNVLEQFHGLASALKSLHTPTNALSRVPTANSTESAPSPGPSIPIIVEPGNADKSNWRHGDLKPANILIFLAGHRLKTLKMADLGLAKKHPDLTGQRITPSSTTFGTRAYEPPEAVTGQGKPRSRLYDIWSLGCVMFEMIVWLLYGYHGLDDFWKTRIDTPWKQTLYYSVLDNTLLDSAEINSSTTRKMQAILAHEPECADPRGSVLRELLLLVKDKLLVVALPSTSEAAKPGRERIDADTLSRELEALMNKVNNLTAPERKKYLWTGRERASVTFQSIINRCSSQGSTQRYPSPSPNSRLTVGEGMAFGQGRGLVLGRSQQTYQHELLSPREWIFTLDNAFAAHAAKEIIPISRRTCNSQKSKLCQQCLNMIELPQSRHQRCLNLDEASLRCDLCALFLRIASEISPQRFGPSAQHEVVLRRTGSKVVLESEGGNWRALSVGRMPGHDLIEAHRNVQISFPQLFEPGSPAHTELLRQWLLDCDENHGDCLHPSNRSSLRLPTRLIEVGARKARQVRLVESGTLHSGDQQLRFAALSYPWGDRRVHQHYFTTKSNHEQHRRKILIRDLPTLLQQAVQVARDIGIGHLWIDALCIVQGPGGDFDEEAERMEDVFSAAYCVLAASRATGASDGFLGERKDRETVTIPDSPLFVCEDIDDFQHDVIEGHLNKRGWVLQERALARRTIYFTERQTYWECGRGIRCETFTNMSNKQASFLGDSNFPRLAEKDTKGGRISLFESLYEQYSRLHFTNDHDRPIAIAGLERRLCHAFDTDGGFGVFHSYLERSLLWQRATSEVECLTKIDFPAGREYVPSWSWMAYTGGIKFLDQTDLPFDGIEWMKYEYQSPWTMLSATSSSSTRSIRDRSNPTLSVVARDFKLESGSESEMLSGIVWDGGAVIGGPLKCVVMGKLRAEESLSTQRHFVLVLKQTDRPDVFERVGVGYLAKNKIDFSGARNWSQVR